jgi:Tol biopolymer transport system component
MPSRRRWALFAVLLVVCIAAAGAAVAAGVREADPATSASAAAQRALPSAEAARRPVILFRSLGGGGTGADGQLALAGLDDPAQAPTRLPLRCDRAYFAGGAGLCLARGSGFAAGYEAKVFGPDLRVRHALDVEGVPSRARVSPDGRYGSVTLFVAGHSYADAGTFSTQTTLIDMASGKKLADLEDFVVTRAGRRITAIDVNFWGVTFAADGDRFYATLATGGKTYLLKGSVSARTATVIHENVECPSLSPDGTRIAYKRRTDSSSRPWHVTVLDLATMRETPLAETRSVDDQLEWLDDDTVLYGVDGDVVAARADGGGRSRVYVPDADSPAVLRW